MIDVVCGIGSDAYRRVQPPNSGLCFSGSMICGSSDLGPCEDEICRMLIAEASGYRRRGAAGEDSPSCSPFAATALPTSSQLTHSDDQTVYIKHIDHEVVTLYESPGSCSTALHFHSVCPSVRCGCGFRRATPKQQKPASVSRCNFRVISRSCRAAGAIP